MGGKSNAIGKDFSEAPIMATDTPLFLKEKHVTYWLRCLRSPLPHQYTSNDSNRMTLAFFTISALDLLGVLHTRTTPAEREEYTTWIYRCQHPDGGFRGFPGTDFGNMTTEENKMWDPANVPATYFALATLCILGDDLLRVNRKECLKWLLRLQRKDGSFGETLGPDGNVEGGMDTRYGYCAMIIRYILRGHAKGDVDGVPDVKTVEMAECIQRSQTYDGGVSEAPYHEAHAGFTYCALGALHMLDRLPLPEGVRGAQRNSRDDPEKNKEETPAPGLSSFDVTVDWLVRRLTTTLDEEDLDEDEEETADVDDHSVASASTFSTDTDPASASASRPGTSSSLTTPEKESSFIKIRSMPAPPAPKLTERREPASIIEDPDVSPFDPVHTLWAGCNGRPNKLADTCYVFWVCGSLSILNAIHLITPTPVRRYLCEKTQHMIAGGFGKLPGDPPDMYHGYLGLAALALLDIGYAGEEGVLARDTSDSSTSVADSSEDENDHDSSHHPTHPSPAAKRLAMKDVKNTRQAIDEQAPNGETIRESRFGDIKIQAVEPEFQDKEGAGEDGEVGDGGGVLRRLDPGLCFSYRAKEWLESLSWRQAIVGKPPKEKDWGAPKYPKKQQDWDWDDGEILGSG